ncbi:ComEC/Rec2 family competence protein [Leucobacter komagatae]|uniref:ComEC/Rec2 family competence protein n=1 Tax=Leucobacter komagatae TaxID=55969 RepID=UPI0006975F1E|nr:ComEC/Rec2 family competence protein [Leucobacter komagatae]
MNAPWRSTATVRGQWRLLGPAVVCWCVAAATIHLPGAARAIAIVSGVFGAALCVRWVIRRRRAAPTTSLRDARFLGVALLSCAFLICLGARIDLLEQGRATGALANAAARGGQVAVLAKLAGYPSGVASFDGEERAWVRGSVVAAAGAPTRGGVPVIAWLPSGPERGWYPGAYVALEGSLVRAPPEGLAAYEIRVNSQAYAGPAVGVGRWVGPAAASMRVQLREAASRVAGAQLVPGLAVGDTSLVSEELDRVMLESSLTHLTAVSGSNCALVITAVTAIAVRLGAGRRLRIVLAAAALGGFVVIVGPDPSVQRAAVMAAVLLVSNFGGKQRQALPALGLATYALLIVNPWQSIQPGFALSVVATGGILLWASPLETWLRARLRLPRVLALPLAVAAVAQFSCAPLLLLLQPGLPVAGVLANLLAAPAAPVGTGMGMLALLSLPVSQPIGEWLLSLAAWPARWIEAAGAVGTALPGGRWYWPGGWTGALLLAGTYLLLGVALAVLTGWAGGGGSRRWPWRGRVLAIPRRTRLVAGATAGIAVGVMCAVVVIVPASVRLGVPHDWAVVACDVGQGDAILVRDPGDPANVMLVDTGDDPELLQACLDLFGVRRIALLVLTHNHQDHVGAMRVALARSSAALVSPPSTEDAGRVALATATAGAGVPTRVGHDGLRGGAPGGLKWEVLAPEPGRAHATANATSLVLSVEVGGVRILLLGDTGEGEQRELVRRHPALRADIVKVAHHGSRDQHSPLYEGLGMRLALFSVGSANSYGHPNAQLVDRFLATGARAYRTDVHGSIAIRVGESGLEGWSAGRRSALLRSDR